MRKRVCRVLLCFLCSIAVTGCKGDDKKSESTAKEQVELVVWVSEEDTDLMNQIIESFRETYQGQADFQGFFQALSQASVS